MMLLLLARENFLTGSRTETGAHTLRLYQEMYQFTATL